ncbi:MAG TPA: hypothetical protein VK432_04140 [Stellaceae bacterium]|nr:hypothetical protein [Stellaceae bacterium]
MAKTAKRASTAKAPGASRGGAMRPVLLAAGLALYWFVEYQDAGGASDVPMWGYVIMVGVRLLADFIGAWVVVSALQLLLTVARLLIAYLRGLWLQASSG